METNRATKRIVGAFSIILGIAVLLGFPGLSLLLTVTASIAVLAVLVGGGLMVLGIYLMTWE